MNAVCLETEKPHGQDPVPGVRILYKSPELDNFIFEVRGPSDCSFENGYFKVHCHIPEEYPFKPPVMSFMTKIWHPNVSSVVGFRFYCSPQTGAICLDVLKDKWTPACNMASSLNSLISLFTDAVPEDPQDWEPAKMYVEDRPGYERKVREWVTQYAQQGMKTEKEELVWIDR